ncbi:MAG: DUF5667 domain-containing protein [bacterium]|nr:DUF5667 domain-containing protein [bacterium]
MKFSDFFKQNNDRRLAAQIKAATYLKMDDTSRERMRAHLFEYAKLRPIRIDSHSVQQKTPQNRLLWLITSHIRPMPVIAAILVVAVSGGGVAAAETSLPGDILYPIKVHVTEEVRATLATTPKAKADWEMDRAERRLEEAATLVLSGKLDEEARAELDTNLDEHIRTAGRNRQQLENENSSDASGIGTNIGAVLLARENILGKKRIGNAVAVALRAETASNTVRTIGASAAHMAESIEAKKVDDDSETVSKGLRTAAKARIKAAKKFLDRSPPSLPEGAREQAKERLEIATEAFSTGDDDDARGNKEEASSNFNSALEAATEIEALISDSSDSDKRDSQDEDNNGPKEEKSGQ